ncbi:hypothetical protein JW766_06330 [Candidatus Dojkabacteria bacterium]|nr:hypothetical protein [Candidatus Dojkabacteria bacterium]
MEEREIVDPAEIREHMTGIDEAVRERVAGAQEAYITTMQEGESPIPLAHRYVIRLMMDKEVSAIDLYDFAKHLWMYPTLTFEPVRNIGTESMRLFVARPLDMLLGNFKEVVALALSKEPDLERLAKDAREKVAKAVLTILRSDEQELHDRIFERLQASVILTDTLRVPAEVITNVLANTILAKMLEAEARRREPSLNRKLEEEPIH